MCVCVCVGVSKWVFRENLKDFRETVLTGWKGMGPEGEGWPSRITYLPSSILCPLQGTVFRAKGLKDRSQNIYSPVCWFLISKVSTGRLRGKLT